MPRVIQFIANSTVWAILLLVMGRPAWSQTGAMSRLPDSDSPQIGIRPATLEGTSEPSTPLENRVRQLEELLHEQTLRQQQLEQQLLDQQTPTSYFIPEAKDDLIPPQAKASDAAASEKLKSTKPTWEWAGRIHADYWAFPGTSPGANAFETDDSTDSVDDRFLFRRVRLAVQGDVADNMRYALQLDFNNPSSPQFKDVYLGWEELPWFQTVLVGNQKRPYGLDHINSSNNNIFLERPFIIEAINQDARRFGVCSYGISEDLAWNWRYGAFLQRDLQNVGTVFATPVDEDYQAEIAGRLANTIWYDEASGGRGYAHWAIAGTVASPDGDAGGDSSARFQTRPEARTSERWLDTGVITGGETYEMLALEGVVNLGAVQVVGEYQQIWMQRDSGFADVDFHGGYVYASYFLTGEHMVWDRRTGALGRVKPFENFFLVRTCDEGIDGGWGAWQVAVRYSHADFTDQDVFGGVGDSLTCGLVWWWNQHARMQFNYIYGDIDQHAPVDGETFAHYHILGTRFHIDF